MPRTIVYPSATQNKAAQTKGSEVRADGNESTQSGDDYGDKLVKYIPGEVLAFFLPAWALFANEGTSEAESTMTWRWIVFFVALVATVGYLLLRAPKQGETPAPPPWYFYVLSALAFVAWAIGTTDAGQVLFCLSSEVGSKFIIMAAVLLIPMIDGLLTRYLPPSP